MSSSQEVTEECKRIIDVEPSSENRLKASNIVSSSDVVLDRNAYTVVKEGQAEVLFPSAKDVFYNPVQEFNRDLSVSVLGLLARQHQEKLRLKTEKQRAKHATLETKQRLAEDEKHLEEGCADEEGDKDAAVLKAGVRCESGLHVLEALAASGLRSCRFALEVGGLCRVVANDVSASAVDAIKRNVQHNRVQQLVVPSRADASMLMHSERKQFDVVDLDPYGSPSVFLDSAVQAVRDGGVLQVTCTDMAVLCGNAPETCHAKYGAVSVRSKMCHEMALRIALQCVESHANRYGRYIEPLLSVSVDFYIRLFVRIHSSQSKVKRSVSKLSHALVCSGCDSWRLQAKCRLSWSGNNAKYQLAVPLADADKCPHCGFTTHLCGPLWSAPIHEAEFVSELLTALCGGDGQLTTHKRLLGVLSVVEEELADVPLYYDAGRLASACRLSVPPMLDVRSALLNAGYRVSSSHCSSSAVKTDAPATFVWDIMRAWEALHPAKRDNIAAGSPAATLLAGPPAADVSFALHALANPESRKRQLRRFQQNPQPNWGPKSRAKTSIFHDAMVAKRTRNQGKKRRTLDSSRSPSSEDRKREKVEDTTAESDSNSAAPQV